MANVVTPGNLGNEFEIGTNVANKITIRVDSTSVVRDNTTGSLAATPPVWDNVAKTITFPSANGAPSQVIDLSQFVADIYVNGGSYDPNLMTLTLVDNDLTTPDITVDLSALVGVSTDTNNLLTDGTDNKPFLECDDIKTSCTNECFDAFGVAIFRVFNV